jgi:hypothetical protein
MNVAFCIGHLLWWEVGQANRVVQTAMTTERPFFITTAALVRAPARQSGYPQDSAFFCC